MDISKAKKFHPLFEEIVDLGFPIYLKQNFMNETYAIELVFKTNNKNYSAEYGGYFPTLDSFVPANSNTAELVDLKTFSLHLGYIGVLKEELRQQKRGTHLLLKLTNLVDKYNMRMDLKIDERFGMSFTTLKRWYEKFDFLYLGNDKMIRFSISERKSPALINGKQWSSLLHHVTNLYEESALDEGYAEKSRAFYSETAIKLAEYKRKELWSTPDLYFIDKVVKDSSMLIAAMDQDEDHPDEEAFKTWAKTT